MSLRTAILCVALGAGAIAVPMMASARVHVDIGVAPPAAQVEVVPAPRVGYVWGPGYWRWRGHRHVWVHGHWIHERHGYRWTPEHWEQRGDRWHFDRGHWDHDRD